MRIASWIGIVSICLACAAGIAGAGQGSTSDVQDRSSTAKQPACVLATNFAANPAGVQAPIRIYQVAPSSGAILGWRQTTAPALIGLAWGPDNRLYGVSEANAPAGYQPNSLYRIDPSTGATTLIGSTGLGPLVEGDLATDPQSGMIYGIDRERLFRFPGVTATSANATAQVVGQVHFPPLDNPWDISGLAFDDNGQLYALTQSTNPNAPFSYVIRLDLAHITNGVIPDDHAWQLQRRFDTIGGLDFVGGALLYASGNPPSQTGSSSQQYSLFEIHLTGATVTSRGPLAISGGISAMVGCRPPPCAPPPAGMAAWYRMEGTGRDRVTGNLATGSGAIAFPGGRVGQSARFQGGYLSAADGPALDQGLGDFSIDLWINVPVLSPGIQAIADKRGSVGHVLRGWVLFLNYNRLALQMADGGTENFADARTMAPGWHHIAVTVDRDNPQGIRFYIDGVAGTAFNPTHRTGSLDNAAPTWFGRDHGFDTPSVGLEIDEVEFFHRVLAQSEVRAIFNAAETGKCLPHDGTGT